MAGFYSKRCEKKPPQKLAVWLELQLQLNQTAPLCGSARRKAIANRQKLFRIPAVEILELRQNNACIGYQPDTLRNTLLTFTYTCGFMAYAVLHTPLIYCCTPRRPYVESII